VFNSSNQLIYANSRDITLGTANYLGPIQSFAGNFIFDPASNQNRRDAHYIVISGNGRIPQVLVDPNDGGNPVFTPIDGDPNNGFLVSFSTGGAIPQNATFVGSGASIGAGTINSDDGGYEMEVRGQEFVDVAGSLVDVHRGRNGDAIRATEGEVVLRKNRVTAASQAGIQLRDEVLTAASATVPAQGARYVFPNAAINPATGVQATNPNHMLPGVQAYNNLITGGQTDGIRTRETFTAVGDVPLGYHLIANNTLHNNAGTGIRVESEGGPSIWNNIATSNGTGFNVLDPNPTRFDRTVVDFNLAFGNGTDFANSGSYQGHDTNRALDPFYVDAAGGDFRVLVNSPALDAGKSDAPDRLGSARPPVRTWAPEDDFHDRKRQDAPTPTTGTGAHPFWDIGALESHVPAQPPPRLSAVSLFTPTGLVPAGATSVITLVFRGRIDLSTLNNSTFVLLRLATGTTIPLTGASITQQYDVDQDVHRVTIQRGAPLPTGPYRLTLRANPTNALRGVWGQMLDGEFIDLALPSGNGTAGGDFVYEFRVV
jgi:parallel beta-helix repeat protein